jgi:hypothetical protein
LVVVALIVILVLSTLNVPIAVQQILVGAINVLSHMLFKMEFVSKIADLIMFNILDNAS